jgi:hypothetical protein
MRCSTAIVVLVLAISTESKAQVSDSNTDNRPVILQFTASAGYKDTPAALAALERTLEAAQPRVVTVTPGEDISEVIARELRFGKSDRFQNSALGQNYSLQKSYKLVEKTVRDLNGPSFKVATLDGTVFVPDIPRWSDSDYTPTKLENKLPKLAIYDESQTTLVRSGTKYSMIVQGRPEIVDRGREHTQSTRNEYHVTAREARFLASADPDFYRAATAFNFPVTARLASTSEPPGGDPAIPLAPLLPAAEASEIRTLLTSARRNVWLFILDTGWPSQESANATSKELSSMLTAVLAANTYLPPVSIANPAYNDQPPINPHCRDIETALAPLRMLDAQPPDMPRVRVVYVPLTRGQGAAPLLQALLRGHYLLQIANKKGIEGRVQLSPDDVAQAEKSARTVVDALPATWPTTQPTVVTDKAIVDAVLWIANAYTRLKTVNSTFFVNESWTSTHEQYSVTYPSPLRGAVVAAVGNTGDQVIGKMVDFAQRCVEHKDTIAVMNFGPNGKECGSGSVDDAYLASAFAFGFTGRIRSGHCLPEESGTSFSAPRVAWVLAAAEAIRKEPIDMNHWGSLTYQYSKHLRKTQDLLGARLNVLEFLKGVAGP